MSQSRNWGFVLDNPDKNLWFDDEEGVVYALYQLERKNDTPLRFRGYLRTKNSQRSSSVKNLIPGARWKMLRGPPKKENCMFSKEQTVEGPYEKGTNPFKRTKKRRALDEVKLGDVVQQDFEAEEAARTLVFMATAPKTIACLAGARGARKKRAWKTTGPRGARKKRVNFEGF